MIEVKLKKKLKDREFVVVYNGAFTNSVVVDHSTWVMCPGSVFESNKKNKDVEFRETKTEKVTITTEPSHSYPQGRANMNNLEKAKYKRMYKTKED